MSKCSSANTADSQPSTSASTCQPISVASSSISVGDQFLIEDGKVGVQNEFPHNETVALSAATDYENGAESTKNQPDNADANNDTTSWQPVSSADSEQSSDKVKLAASNVHVTPTQKSQLGTNTTLPNIVHGLIVDNAQTRGNSICNIESTTAASLTATALTNPTSSHKVFTNTNNVSQNNLWKLSNHVVKIDPTSKILSKSTPSVTKSPSSRPDLVASSISNLNSSPLGASKTRPLLMNHHHRHNQLHGAKLTNTDSGKIVSLANNATKTIATTLSSQLILSSIITANPGHRVQQLPASTGLDGLHFSLAPNQSQMTISRFTPSNNLIETSTAPSTSKTPSMASKIKVTTTRDKSCSESTTFATTTATTNPKSKLKSQASPSSANSTPTSLDNPTRSPSATSGISNSGNAAAARLLDLGKRLLEATREGNVEQVRHLVVDSGAPFTSDWLGTTALHIAAQDGAAEIVEILIRGGVNRDARTKLERTALHLAAQSGRLEVVDLLVTNGADVNGRDMLKMTPLHWAVERGHICVVERLLLAGADFRMKSKFQLTPLDMATNAGFVEILELFKSWEIESRSGANLDMYRELEASLDDSHEFLDIDYHLALVDTATNSHGDSMMKTEESCMDLVGLEWNKLEDFEPELFLPTDSEDEQKVEYLMKIVEELQRENQQLKQKVEQLSTTDQ